ncbi:hypothetical protein [Porphyromonas sp.]
MNTKSSNRTISISVYASVWLVLILLQTLVTTMQGTEEMSVFSHPRLYFSTWITDLYLVVVFYLNYFLFAPRLMRRRLFQPYLWVVLVAALIGFIIPILCYLVWGLSMPGLAEGTVPLSSLGVIGVVAAMAIGLSVRGLYEWDSLGQEVLSLREEEKLWKQEREELLQKLRTLQPNTTDSDHQVALPTTEGEQTSTSDY